VVRHAARTYSPHVPERSLNARAFVRAGLRQVWPHRAWHLGTNGRHQTGGGIFGKPQHASGSANHIFVCRLRGVDRILSIKLGGGSNKRIAPSRECPLWPKAVVLHDQPTVCFAPKAVIRSRSAQCLLLADIIRGPAHSGGYNRGAGKTSPTGGERAPPAPGRPRRLRTTRPRRRRRARLQ